MPSVLEIAKKLNKDYGDKNLAILANTNPSYERLASGAMGYDFPMYGGDTLGRIVVHTGMEHSGKTTAALVKMAAFQRKYPEKVCVFIDVEHALDMDFIAEMTGIDWTKVIYVNPTMMNGNQILGIAEEFILAEDMGMMIIDSIAALVSSSDFEGNMEKDNGMRSSMAKPLNMFLKKVMGPISKNRSILLLINQTRIAGVMPNGAIKYGELCGKAVAFYTTTNIRFATRTFTDGDIVDKREGEKADGFRLQFSVLKNKTARVDRGGGFMTFRYDSGLDFAYDLIEVALNFNLIPKEGNTFTLTDLLTGKPYDLGTDEVGRPIKLVGKGKVRDYIKNNPTFAKTYIEMLTKHISNGDKKYGKLLDERDLGVTEEMIAEANSTEDPNAESN